MDSGIHLGSSQEHPSPPMKSKPNCLSRSKLSRFDRSMSVPLHAPLLSELLDSPLSGNTMHTGRRMDFALCKFFFRRAGD